MQVGNLGAMRFTFYGDWKPQAYTVNSSVRYENSMYTAVKNVAANDVPGRSIGWSLSLQGDARVPLTKDTTFYVRTHGDDEHDGLTEAKSLKTVGAAISLLNYYDPRDKKIIIDIGQGTFTIMNPITCTGYDYMNLFLQGAGVQKTFLQRDNTTSTISINASLSGVTCLNHLSTSHSEATLAIRLHNGNGTLRMNGRRLRARWGRILLIGATIQLAPNDGNPSLTFDGILAECGEIICDGATVFEAVDNPSFSTFAICAGGGIINFYTCTFKGTATGRKYSVYQGGVITGQGANYDLTSLLGDTDGVSSGGAVIGIGGLAKISGNILQTGAVRNGNNIASVTVVSDGVFDVKFNVAAPSPNYTVVAGIGGHETQTRTVGYKDLTTTGFRVLTRQDEALVSIPFSVACFW